MKSYGYIYTFVFIFQPSETQTKIVQSFTFLQCIARKLPKLKFTFTCFPKIQKIYIYTLNLCRCCKSYYILCILVSFERKKFGLLCSKGGFFLGGNFQICQTKCALLQNTWTVCPTTVVGYEFHFSLRECHRCLIGFKSGYWGS